MRPISIEEYARVQQFPDDWKFAGGINHIYKQIGNAVPLGLGFNQDDSIRFFVLQTISRSIVTSWGSYVEQFLKYSGCEVDSSVGNDLFNKSIKSEIKGSNIDLFKINDNIIFPIQVKSGPNTMNVEMVQGLNRAFDFINNLEVPSHFKNEDIKRIKAILGMTYGKREGISSQIRDNLEDFNNSTKIGRELWDFIAEEKNYYITVLDLMNCASKAFLDIDFMQLIEQKINSIKEEWNTSFGQDDFKKVIADKFI